MKRFIEKNLHLTFELGIFFKGVYGVIEMLSGAILLITSEAFIFSKLDLFTQDILVENPENVITKYAITVIRDFNPSTQHFVAVYLLLHGFIKFIIVVALFKKKSWAYPTAGIVFTFFIVYQVQRFFHTHSIFLLILSAFDFLIILLTWHEYSYLQKQRRKMEIG